MKNGLFSILFKLERPIANFNSIPSYSSNGRDENYGHEEGNINLRHCDYLILRISNSPPETAPNRFRAAPLG